MDETTLSCFRYLLSQEKGIVGMRRMICDFIYDSPQPKHSQITFLFNFNRKKKKVKRRKEKLMIFGIFRGRLIDPFFFALYTAYFCLTDGLRLYTNFFPSLLLAFLPSRAELKPLVKLKARIISQHFARNVFFSVTPTQVPELRCQMINDSNINIDSINCTRH